MPIQEYSTPFVTLPYLQPCHVLSPHIFRTVGLFKTLWDVDYTYSEPCHRTLFRHIQNLVQHLHMQKPDILGILQYSELFHNCIPTHIQNPAILQTFMNIQNFDIFKTWHTFRTLSKIYNGVFCKNS